MLKHTIKINQPEYHNNKNSTIKYDIRKNNEDQQLSISKLKCLLPLHYNKHNM